MKKIYFWSILILFILALLPTGLWAQNDTQRSASDSQREPNTHVTATHAMDVGYAFMRTGNGSRSGGTQSGNVRKQAMQLVYTGRATDTLTRATTDCYYVFALQPKGFVIVAADNRVEPILGYSYDNNFVVENMPEHIKGWLNDYEKQIEVVTKSARPAEASIQTKWNSLESGQPISNTRNDITVGPLLTTTWDQGQYYNAFCPADASGAGGHVYTGCVATAMAQIINYWQYPIHGRSKHGYYSYYDNLEVDYEAAQYDYANMPDVLNSTSMPAQVTAVAQLMYHCGVAVNMQYDNGSSGAYDADIRVALVSQFKYSPYTGLADRSRYSATEWNDLLRNEISQGQPVLYCGISGNVGHAFVCDGYNNNNYFHFNFGWSGNGNGWYLTSAINTGGYEFNSNQSAIMGIVPDSLSNVLYSSSGYMEYTIDSTIFFGDELDDNPFRYQENEASTDWYSLGYNTVTFYPADTTKQLVLEVLSVNNHYISIHDGSTFGSSLRWFNENGSNNGLYPVLSTQHALKLDIGYRQRSEQGFRFRISYDDRYPCRWVTNIVATADTTAIHLHWHEVGNASQWEIEYGRKGFHHGEGTIIAVNDTSATITGLLPLREYDIYVRSVCDTNHVGVWSAVVSTRTESGYWTDLVTSQPEGYVEDSLGNAYISTAEGLAWFSKHSQDNNFYFSGRKAVLTADINLAGHKWKSVRFFRGVFDGQGHKIDSMYVIDNRASLIGDIADAVIKNVMLTNCYSYSTEYAGGLVREAQLKDTIMNCFVSGIIDASGEAGPIIAEPWGEVSVINCASNCRVSGREAGGILGGGSSGYRTSVKNCYSAGSNFTTRFMGAIVGYGENVTIDNCYGHNHNSNTTRIIGGGIGNIQRNNSWFDESDSGYYLIEPMFFELDSQYYSNLKDVLNAGVRKYNLEGLRLWVDDTAGINEGMPILGPEYTVTCPNIRNITAQNVKGSNGLYGVKLSWDEIGHATIWDIKYHIQDSTNEVRLQTINNPDTVWGLTEQSTYLFSVRPICSSTNRGGWSDEFSHVFDRSYWTEIVTAQPDGYFVDETGNVTISSAEGLAWLISTVNGLNGQNANSFENKSVTLTQDVNIGQYKWTAINNFLGTFDGGGHTIKKLYINELTNNQGMFSDVNGGCYLNIIVDSADVKGKIGVGILFGRAHQGSMITNCHVSGTVYGESMVGGMAGIVSGSHFVSACSSSGTVRAKYDSAGGLIGEMLVGTVNNCYSRCNVIADRYTAGGLVGFCQYGTQIENCYAVGNVDGFTYKGGLTGGFAGSDGVIKNCYAGGMVSRTGYMTVNGIPVGYQYGAIAGTTKRAPRISHCYGLADMINPVMVGAPDPDAGSPIVSETAFFDLIDGNVILRDSIAVAQTYYHDILEVLNAWVDVYDTTGKFLHWIADSTGENNGLPIFNTEIRYNTLTVSVADSTPHGTVSGSGTYSNIEPTVISATPDYGYHFAYWNDGNTANPRGVILTQDTTFTAIFAKNKYCVVGNTDLSVDNSFDFEDSALDEKWTLMNGEQVNRWYITTLEDTNRALFISNDNGVSNAYTPSDLVTKVFAYTTMMLDSGQYNYSYNWRCNGHGNSVLRVALFPNSEELNAIGWSSGYLPAKAIALDGGYKLGRQTTWQYRSGIVNVSAANMYRMVFYWYSDSYVDNPPAAIDNIQFHNNIPEEDSHGYVLGNDTVPYLDTVILTAVPYEGYAFTHWTDGNTDNPRAVVADADKFYWAVFDYAPKNLTLLVADSTPYGRVSGGGLYDGNPANIVTISISATPDYGYHFVQWNDGNTDNPRAVTLTQDTSFTAIFGTNMYSVVGSTEGSVYKFDFEDSSLDEQWVFLNEDYVNRWCIAKIDSINRALFISNDSGIHNNYTNSSNSYVFAYATIELDSGQYHYTFDWRCNGRSDNDCGVYDYMRAAIMPASNEHGYYQSYYWYEGGAPYGALSLDGKHGLSGQTQWENTNGEISVPTEGTYELVLYWYNCNPGRNNPPAAIDNIQFFNLTEEESHGYVLGSDTVPYLDTVILTAVPDNGYQFARWNDGNTDNPRIVVATSNKNYRAIFEFKPITLTLNVADETPYGTVTGGGTYSDPDSVNIFISATPDYGYHFISWNDGNTENPRYITLTQDSSFTAFFERNTYFVVGNSEISINYSFDFEDSTLDRQWTLWNRNYISRWYIDTVDNTNRALFISNDYGQSNTFDIESPSCVYAYTTLHLVSGQYNFNYDWRSSTGQYNNFFRVTLVPASFEFVDSEWLNCFSLPNDAVRLHSSVYWLYSDFVWTNTSGTLSINEGGDYKIWIQWHNSYSYNLSNLSATIDNIHFYNNIPAEENNHGYVLGGDTVLYLDSVVLTAVPNEGYQFVQWHDGNTDNPRTVVADADKVLRAMFERAFVISDSIVACDSYLWHGNVYAASTMLFDTLPATGGGDSIVAHYLMVNHPDHTAITETACESYVWTHADGTTQTCTVSGDYTYSHIDANGCTQVDTLHLTVYHTVNSASFVTTCDSYTWTHADGTTQVCNISDDYIYSYENAYGCPQVDTLHLTVNHATSGEITISACDSFDWYDSTYTESGDYVLTLSNMTGCDSVVTLHLTVNHPAHTAITETACESYVWTHADGTTQTYFASGDYLYSHSDVNGCVQVDTLHLAIHYPSTSVDEQIACGPFTWINGETYTSGVFGPTYTLTNEAGCDSVVTLSLTMYQSDTTQFSITACNSFVWGDNTYTETGDYAQTSEGSNGCLSVTIMHLTINYSDTTEESATACDSYLWHGNNYTESGDYTVYYTNTDGCNSMANLHLTVNHSTVGEIVATACENYEWHGIVYTESGDYDYTLTAANGCDSVVILHLTVNEDVATEFTITTADSCYVWNGQTYCVSGDYTQNFETVDGCDSVVTLHLTITVGIDNYDLANVMKLYPNPTSDLVNVQLTINNEQLGEVGIQVFDVYGRLLEVINMADARGASLQTAQIDLSQYAKGVYFVKAVSEGKVIAVRKVVKR